MRAVRPLVLALAALGLAGPSPATPGVMDRLAQVFARGRRVNVQVVFDRDDVDDNWSMNTSVAQATDELDARGERVLTVTTATYTMGGVEHDFSLRVRDGRLERVLLRTRSGEAWAEAPAAAFRFDVTEEVPCEASEAGEVVLSAWGLCNEGRGSTRRSRATIVLRSFPVADAADLGY